jgi:hypothetical protein
MVHVPFNNPNSCEYTLLCNTVVAIYDVLDMSHDFDTLIDESSLKEHPDLMLLTIASMCDIHNPIGYIHCVSKDDLSLVTHEHARASNHHNT